jgi:hypothetical protein
MHSGWICRMSEELLVSPSCLAFASTGKALTTAQFQQVAGVPPEIEWFA